MKCDCHHQNHRSHRGQGRGGLCREPGRRQQNDWAGLFMQIGTAIYQAAVNIADERTWTTLPKQFQACHFSTPPDRKIELETPGGRQRMQVTIGDGIINLIYVKSINANRPAAGDANELK